MVQLLSRFVLQMLPHLAYSLLSVVAVPGLASHAIGSWRSKTNNIVWLRDYLPVDVPNVRVLLYGYDTSLVRDDSKYSKDSIETLGQRFLESIMGFRSDTV